MTIPEPSGETTAGLDPGMVRAGKAAAARRRELNISQRRLAAEGIINAGALIAFEKGRSWPRERTRAKLEEVLRWPPGTIARLRAGETPAPTPRDEAPAPSEGQAELVAQAVITAVDTMGPAIESLPATDDPGFIERVLKLLAHLRQLESVIARAARVGNVSTDVIKALSAVRRNYDELMTRAAASPNATLGHRLYAARKRANLQISETAHAAGVSDDDIARVEAEEPVPVEVAAAVETLIKELDQ